MKKSGAAILETRQHYALLDGLRGTAALTIVVFHFLEMVYTDYSKNFLGHGFLAVDFFFCLSGFVIGYAYDNRIREIGVWEFFKSRLIRLHPLVVLGSILGLLGFLFDPLGGHPELYSAGKILLMFVCSIFLIPFPAIEERGFALFGFNSPSWSLFYEYIANIVYAFVLCRVRKSILIILAAASAIWLCVVAFKAGTLIGGWDGKSAWDGMARLSFSFLAGLLVYRANLIIQNKLGFIGLSVLLLLPFVMPYFKWNWLAESLVVIFYFPLIISLGAGANIAQQGMNKLCAFFGKISYPLYMTHIPVIWSFGHYYSANKPDTQQLFYIIGISTVLLVAMAYLVMVVYDIPVRKYLTNRRKKALAQTDVKESKEAVSNA